MFGRAVPSALVAALVAASVVLVAPEAASAAGTVTSNPLAGAGGFTVLAMDDLRFGNQELEGSAAAGGDISIASSTYNVIHQAAGNGNYSLPQLTSTGRYVALVTAGQFALTPGSRLQVNPIGATATEHRGIAIVGDSSNGVVTTRGSGVCLSDGTCSYGLEQSSTTQSIAETTDAGAFDELVPSAGRDDLKAWNRAIATGTLTGTTSVTATPTSQGLAIDLTANSTNVWTVAASALPASGWKLEFGTTQPSATTPLVIDVTAPDGATVNLPTEIVNMYPSGSTNDVFAPYLLWNIDQSAGQTVTLTSPGISPGSVLAPYSHVISATGTKTLVEGQIVGDDVDLLNTMGEVHNYTFVPTLTRPASTTGGFSLTKTIAGDASLVPTSTSFDVSYFLDGAATAAGVITVAADGVTVNGPSALATGTVVTFAETGIPAVPGGGWGTPVFSPTSVTIGIGTTTAVSLTNTFTASGGGGTPGFSTVAYVGSTANGTLSAANPTITDHVAATGLTVGSGYRLVTTAVSIASGSITTVTTAPVTSFTATGASQALLVDVTVPAGAIATLAGTRVYLFVTLTDASGTTLADDIATSATSPWFSATSEWATVAAAGTSVITAPGTGGGGEDATGTPDDAGTDDAAGAADDASPQDGADTTDLAATGIVVAAPIALTILLLGAGAALLLARPRTTRRSSRSASGR